MKIRKFSTAVAATAIFAAGAILAPAASAVDLEVKDGVCTTTESYEGEFEEVAQAFLSASDATIAELKKKLPGSAEDIDAYLSWTTPSEERSAALERINAAGVNAGFNEGESGGILSIILYTSAELELDSDSDLPSQANSMTQDEAQANLDGLEESLEAVKKNQIIVIEETYTSSAPAISVISPLKGAYVELVETEIEILESCVAGNSGTFSYKSSPGGGGVIGGGGSANSSFPSLSSF